MRNAMRYATLVVLVVSAPAWAINKCKGPDGKISFQDAPCPGQGEKIDVRPASGSAPQMQPAPATAAIAVPTAPPAKKEGAFGESWQRKTYLENRGIADARAAIDNHQRECLTKQAELAARKGRANNNLAGATWEQSISAEMQAAATLCDSRSRELRAELDALQKELRDLQAKQ